MNEDPSTATATVQPPPAAPVKKKGGKGCWIWGCASLFLLFLLSVGAIVAISVAVVQSQKDLNKVADREYESFMKDHAGVTVERHGFVDQQEDSAQYQIVYRDGTDGPQTAVTIVYHKNEAGMWTESMTTSTTGADVQTTVGADGTVTTTTSSGEALAPTDSGEPAPAAPTP